MGITEILTIVFVVFKLLGVIEWAWFFVLLPEIIALVIYLAIIVCYFVQINKIHKETKRFFK